MSIVGETSQIGINEIYNISLGLMVCLPALSMGVTILSDENINKRERMYCLFGIAISCGLVVYSKNLLMVSMAISIITILYYKYLKQNQSSDFSVYSNTMIAMSVLLAVLYSIQSSLKK